MAQTPLENVWLFVLLSFLKVFLVRDTFLLSLVGAGDPSPIQLLFIMRASEL